MPLSPALLRVVGRTAAALLIASGITVITLAGNTAVAAGGAISTTTNVDASTGNGDCVHPTGGGSDPVNCNTYAAQTDVWLSNLPQALPDGNYFFAVIAPGGQADPNDGAPDLLSSDPYTDRTFTVSGSTVSSTGTHLVENGRIQLADFGVSAHGVYIVAVCSADTIPAVGGDCKYDAFKVGSGDEAQPLLITKDAAGANTRTYAWTIDKSVDRTIVRQVGGNAIFNYTVSVGHDVGTVGNVGVTGTITVTNPNSAPVTGVDVTDVLSDTTICTVTGGTDATIPADDDATFAYTCSLSGLPAGQLDNTATAAWDDQIVGGEFLGNDSVDFTFTDITFTESAVNGCVAVTDTFKGSLGTTCVGDPNPQTYPYSRTIAVAPGCSSYDNTATFTATDDPLVTGSDSQTVTVCGPLATGALTIGFWSNKNGQGVITGGSSTGTVCNVGTYLRTFAPFQDLSATAKCADVAKYFMNVFNAANASGSTMNAMLKAQMLATALDVYFTGPGSTTATQKFLPHSNLGGIAIDLTFICKNPLACTTFEDVSSSFGGATSLTVSQMLAYAAGQSNVGGSAWYGQVKTVQEKAKDAFDAINNQVAFGP